MANQIADLVDEAFCTEIELTFDDARKFVAANVNRISDADKLKLYGLYKQATEGPCTTSRPGFFDMKGRSKWDAWKAVGDMPANEAMAEYAEVLTGAVAEWEMEGGDDKAGGAAGPVVSSLAAGQADPGDEDPETLHDWVTKGDIAKVEELLTSDADINARDEEGCTPLHFAADRGNTCGSREMIALLVGHGAALNAVDVDGATPLHYAVLCGNEEVCKQLLDLGADPSVEDSSGATAQQQAPEGWGCW